MRRFIAACRVVGQYWIICQVVFTRLIAAYVYRMAPGPCVAREISRTFNAFLPTGCRPVIMVLCGPFCCLLAFYVAGGLAPWPYTRGYR